MSENCGSEKGLRNIRIFITADALLTAVLMVWAQLWMQPSLQLWTKNIYSDNGTFEKWFEQFEESAFFGLLLTYPAIFCALFALAWAGWYSLNNDKEKTHCVALWLFGTAIALAIINVIQSSISVLWKFFKGLPIFQPLNLNMFPTWFWIVFGFWAIVVVIFTGFMFTHGKEHTWIRIFWWCWLLIFGILLGILSLYFALK
jgi:hypothetical protein